LKIIFIITRSDTIGGAQVYVINLVQSLIAAGYKALILVGGAGPFTRELERKEIPYRSLRYLSRYILIKEDWNAILEIRGILKEVNPDLVSVHSSKAGWLGRMAARSLGIPVVFTAHGWSFSDGIPLKKAMIFKWAERFAAPCADKIITVSEYDQKLALKSRVASSKKLIAIHNSVPDITPDWLASPENQPPRIMMIARFEGQKDHLTLFNALAMLPDREWYLELVGDGPLRPAFEKLAFDLGIGTRVKFWGECRDIAQKLSKAQLFVLTSHWEGFPLSILEAMRAGLPVIASDVGGVPEQITDGENGFLVPRNDSNILQQKLLQLIDNPKLRVQMGAAGRDHYTAEFNFDTFLKKTLMVYHNTIKRITVSFDPVLTKSANRMVKQQNFIRTQEYSHKQNK
jgi:glycosyltransferase involved in cell wall biosynthesis